MTDSFHLVYRHHVNSREASLHHETNKKNRCVENILRAAVPFNVGPDRILVSRKAKRRD
jgi:hypothetical protein